MFLIDKYTINNTYDIKFNKIIFKKLLKLDSLFSWINKNKINSDFNSLPNLLVYGQNGSGKKSLIRLLIKRIFGKNINTKSIKYLIKGYGSNNVEITINQSLYHIEIEPTGSGFDKYLVQEVIKKYANKKVLSFESNRTFKIIWIHNIHKLSYYAQTALRCTMEKFAYTCKFILTGIELTKVLSPIRSRCIIIRLPSPSNEEILNILMDISYKENKFIKLNEYYDIINNCDHNIKKAIWDLDIKINHISVNYNWKKYLGKLIDIINLIIDKKFLVTYVKDIRTILYKIFITNISGKNILKELLNKILLEFNYLNLDYEIINICTQYNNALSKGKRSIIHLEAFIYNIIELIYKTKIKISRKKT